MPKTHPSAGTFRAIARVCCAAIALNGAHQAIAQPADDAPAPHGTIIDELLIVERDGFNIVPGQASHVGRFFSNNTTNVTILGSSVNLPTFMGMDFKPGTATLYGIENTTNSLRSISAITGASTVIGFGSGIPLDPFRLGGMSFNVSGNVLYATDSAQLFTIDEATGGVIHAYTLNYVGMPAGMDIGDIAVAPIDVSLDPFIPAGSILGIAVNSSFGQPARLVKIALSGPNQADVTSLATLQVGPFVVGFYDQGLDFSTQGVLYACLQGEFQSATMYRVDVSGAATMGQCTFMGIVNGNPASWDVGDLAVGPNPIVSCPTCKGDLTGDSLVNGRDIQEWVSAAIQYAATLQIPVGKRCADMDGDSDIDCGAFDSDLQIFLARLLQPNSACQP